VSDPRVDALAQSARNRGLKLVRSRVRTPGKPGFGKTGLVDASGKNVFGMDSKGPAADPDTVEEFLRNLEAQDWGASLGGADPPNLSVKKKHPKADAPTATPSAGQARARKRSTEQPRVPPRPQIRNAKAGDAARLAELIGELGHDIEVEQVRNNLALLGKTKETPLVVTLDDIIVGMCGVARRVVISRPAPLGRITSLIVTKDTQGLGLGRMLVEAAESWMRDYGCKLVEVTSNDRRSEAHAFYRHMGYERTSIRFAKKL